MWAVSNKEIEKKEKENPFEHFYNVIIFPCVGKHPLTSQISGGDLDGDIYFITWDPELIPRKEDI